MSNYITKEGLEKLKKELKELKTVKRKELADRLRSAIALGDLSENFEYAQAKEDQEFVERRIRELEAMIANTSLAPQKDNSGNVQIGSTVVLEAGGQQFTFKLTGAAEANPLEQKISAQSPLGAALLGRKKGDSVEVKTPSGIVKYTIVQID